MVEEKNDVDGSGVRHAFSNEPSGTGFPTLLGGLVFIGWSLHSEKQMLPEGWILCKVTYD